MFQFLRVFLVSAWRRPTFIKVDYGERACYPRLESGFWAASKHLYKQSYTERSFLMPPRKTDE